MMYEIIQVSNASYVRYEELLVKRDNLKKAAFHWEREYVRTFGDKTLKLFEIKIECIRKKKIISFYQAALNHGKTINRDELRRYLDSEMASYRAQLEDMVKDHQASRETETITEREYLGIKKIYRKLAKSLHPDINPKTSEVEELKDLWERITIAYKCNKLKELEELEILALSALKSLDKNAFILSIANIDDKISAVESEIDVIKNTDPYQYKYLLNDREAVVEKNQELDDEYDSYKEYEMQLDDMILEFMGSGVSILWKMD